MIERVRIISPEQWVRGTKCYIGENEIRRVVSADFHIDAESVPEFIFTTRGLPDIDVLADVKFDFTPQTVEQAVNVLRNELLKHGDLYVGFWTSIESSVKEQKPFFERRSPCWIAQEILDRIIGED